MATWNVRSLLQPGASRDLKEVLVKYKVDILALQEIRWRTMEVVKLKEYTLFNSGSKENRRGTGFMIRNRLRSCVIGYRPINDRICVLRLKGKFFNISLISVHAPIEDSTEEEKERFYGELERTYDQIQKHDVKMVLGDFNAKIGKENSLRPVIGKHSKHDTTTENGIRLVDFAAARNMVISSTCFNHREIHKETWISPDGNTRNQIDHIIIDKRHATDISDIRSFRGAQCGSDHFLVRAAYRQNISHKGYNMEKLEEEGIKNKISKKICDKLKEKSGNGIEGKWKNLKDSIQSAAEEILGRKQVEAKNDWYDDECKQAIEERNQARIKMLQRTTRAVSEDYSQKRNIAKKICRKKKRQYELEKMTEIQYHYETKNTRKFYKEIKQIKTGFNSTVNIIKDKKGNILAGQKQILDRWVEYFKETLNKERNKDYGKRQINFEDDENDEEIQPPTKEEIGVTIRCLKNNKSPGLDSIPAEMFKYGGQGVIDSIQELISEVWEKEEMPCEWSKAILCPI